MEKKEESQIQRSKKRVSRLNLTIKQAQFLMESGMLEAYERKKNQNLSLNLVDVLRSLCKAGLPEGNIFDYTASKLMQFETKWKTQQKKKAIIAKYKNMGKEKEEEDKLPLLTSPKRRGKAKRGSV